MSQQVSAITKTRQYIKEENRFWMLFIKAPLLPGVNDGKAHSDVS